MEILHHNTFGKGPHQLVILHGFLGMGDNWKTHARVWAEKGFQVHLIDQRNHGRSFWSAEFNYELMAEDLLRWMDHHKVDKATLLGHSMGGKTAMTVASKYPERLEKLIVADISPRAYPPHHQQILSSLSALDFQKITSRKAAEEALSHNLKEASLRQFLLKNLFWKAPNQLGLRINIDVLKNMEMVIGTPLDSDAYCTLPTLFLAGGNSNYILPEDQLLIKKHFPKAQIETISHAGHWLHAENPTAFSAAFLRFLDI